MTAAITAAAVTAAATIGSSVASAQGAKKAAKTQAAGAKQAGQVDQASVDRANAIATQQYQQDLARQQQQLGIATGRLDPYAQVGGNALGQLGELSSAPHGAISAQAASGTDPKIAAQIQDWVNRSQTALNENQQNMDAAQQRGDWAEYQRLNDQQAGLKSNFEQASSQANNIQQYVPAQAAQAANGAGGDLYRGFSGTADFLNDPTSGANYDPAAFRQSSATGAKLTDAQIGGWLKQHAGASDSEIAQAMQQYGVSAQQLAHATGMDINTINARLAGARNPNGTTQAPNLMANFDESGWLKQQGLPQNALTKNLNAQQWLGVGGHTAADLTKDFNRTGYLKNAGFTEADLARKFTANDFKVDPGYQFRLQQGTQGIENSAAAQGGQLSGATLKALAKYNQNFGSNEYNNVFNRFQATQQQAGNALGNAQNAFNQNRSDLNNNLNSAFNRFGQNRQNVSDQFTNAYTRFGANRDNANNVYNQAYNRQTADRTNSFNRLALVAGIGQTAATNQAGMNMNYAGNTSGASQNYTNLIGNNITGGGQRQAGYIQGGANANSAGQIGQANALSNGFNGVGNAAMNYAYLRQPTQSVSNAEFFNTQPIFK